MRSQEFYFVSIYGILEFVFLSETDKIVHDF